MAATLPVKLTAVVDSPTHTTSLPTAFTVGVGLIVMVNVSVFPGQDSLVVL